MKKQVILSTIAVFIAWMVMDFVIHGVILMPTYERTASLWRPQDEMKNGLMLVVTLIAAAMFSLIYVRLIGGKSVGRGVEFGLYFGVATGVGMGYGTYAFTPIPHILAISWFLGTIVEAAAAGAIVGWITRQCPAAAC